MDIYLQILLINDVCHFIVVLSCMQLSLKTCNEEKNKTVITNSRGHLCGIVQNMDWTGLDNWTGQLDWTVGLDYWTGLLDWISNGIFSIK